MFGESEYYNVLEAKLEGTQGESVKIKTCNTITKKQY